MEESLPFLNYGGEDIHIGRTESSNTREFRRRNLFRIQSAQFTLLNCHTTYTTYYEASIEQMISWKVWSHHHYMQWFHHRLRYVQIDMLEYVDLSHSSDRRMKLKWNYIPSRINPQHPEFDEIMIIIVCVNRVNTLMGLLTVKILNITDGNEMKTSRK